MAAETAPTVTEKPLLLSSWICPYVQRVWVALNAKHADVKRVNIDLKQKPEWFLAISPMSKVPVITYLEGDSKRILYESLVLGEWVEDYYKDGPALLPANPAQRAVARIIISRFDANLVGKFYKLLMTKDKATALEAAEGIRQEVAWLEGQISSTGPYFLGEQFTLVDSTLLPWFMRANLLEHYRGFKLLEGREKLARWVEAAEKHPAVQGSLEPPAGKEWKQAMIESYVSYGGEPINFFA